MSASEEDKKVAAMAVGDDDDDEDIPDPNLDWILGSKLRWIFVGGKGGVGKTTVTCALGSQLARRCPKKRFLIISTDPAHNTSDAFAQKFGSEPTPVTGFDNLSVMEIDASNKIASFSLPELAAEESSADDPTGGLLSTVKGMLPEMQGIMGNMPGVDEAIGFMEIIGRVDTLDYDIVLFDTAPTGHTLRLLGMPDTVRKMLKQVETLQTRFGGMLSGVIQSLGANMDPNAQRDKIKSALATTERLAEQFKNPDITTFIPVMIPEFLSLYETERLVQELSKYDMDVSSVVINQLLPPSHVCPMCQARIRMQNKYVTQAEDLYGLDFHLVKMILRDHEIRGIDQLLEYGSDLFSKH